MTTVSVLPSRKKPDLSRSVQPYLKVFFSLWSTDYYYFSIHQTLYRSTQPALALNQTFPTRLRLTGGEAYLCGLSLCLPSARIFPKQSYIPVWQPIGQNTRNWDFAHKSHQTFSKLWLKSFVIKRDFSVLWLSNCLQFTDLVVLLILFLLYLWFWKTFSCFQILVLAALQTCIEF